VSWITRTLGDVCDDVRGTIRTGPFGSQLHESDYLDEGIPVVMPKDIVGGKVSSLSIARISETDAHRLAQHRLSVGEIVYGRRGDIGRQALITHREAGWLCGTGCLRISLGNTILDPIYLHYYLSDADVVTGIANQAVGATMPNLNTAILRSVPVTYPPLPVQRKIAAILSAYDDLIENNTRRIQILEEMAQTLYREWFVHFRFPGHEQIKMVESEMGLIPEKWRVTNIGTVVDYVARGVTPQYVAHSSRFIINQKANRGLLLDANQLKELAPSLKLPEDKLARFGDLLINCLGEGTLGRVHFFTGPERVWAVDQHITICRASDLGITNYLYWMLSSEDGQAKIQSLKSGTTSMTMFNISSLRGFQFYCPNIELLTKFFNICNPLWKSMCSLTKVNLNLCRTRDLLLPKLISGEVDIAELDIAI